MHRFYCPYCRASGNKIIISDRDEVHHLKDVLRLKINERIAVFDGKGREYSGFIDKFSKEKVVVNIEEIKTGSQKDAPLEVTLAVAMPKRGRMEYLIEKCTELGVDTIIPMRTARTVVAVKKDKEPLRLGRWKKLSIEAAKQSGRRDIPQIKQVMELKEVLAGAKDYGLAVLFCLSDEKRQGIAELLSTFKKDKILLLVGPEGDFTPQEVSLAKEAGCALASLGERALKVDTACIAIMAWISFKPPA